MRVAHADRRGADYDTILDAINKNRSRLLFIYSHGGTSKINLWKTIILKIRSDDLIILIIFSFEIALLLLSDGQTVYSRFKILI